MWNNNGFGGYWIIILIILFCGCGSWGCGNSCCCGNSGCCCNNGNCCCNGGNNSNTCCCDSCGC